MEGTSHGMPKKQLNGASLLAPTSRSWLHSSVAALTTILAWVSSFWRASTSLAACSSLARPPKRWQRHQGSGRAMFGFVHSTRPDASAEPAFATNGSQGVT
jgi:hypothetical protein